MTSERLRWGLDDDKSWVTTKDSRHQDVIFSNALDLEAVNQVGYNVGFPSQVQWGKGGLDVRQDRS